MIELAKEYYLISVLCGTICAAITFGGGWLLIRGLESLKSDEE